LGKKYLFDAVVVVVVGSSEVEKVVVWFKTSIVCAKHFEMGDGLAFNKWY